MARKRMVDPSIWTDDGFLQLSLPARLLFIGMITTADDEGRGQGTAASLKAAVFPSDDISINDVENLKAEIACRMRVIFYESDGRKYYQLCRWHNHQYVQNAKPSKIPCPVSTEEHVDDTIPSSPNTKQDNTKQDNVPVPPSATPEVQKPKRKKAEPDPTLKPLIQYYIDKHKEIRGFEPTVAWSRDMAIMQKIRQGYKPEAIRQLLDMFFAWKGRSIFTLRAFYDKVDTLYGVLKDKAEGKR